MKPNLLPAICEMEKVVVLLNDCVRQTGDIPKNNKQLWGEHLHKWDHLMMLHIIAVLDLCRQQEPDLFTLDQDTHLSKIIDKVYEGMEINKKEVHYWGKIKTRNLLDKKENKGDYWKFVMHLREVWNKIHGAPLPIYK